MAKKILRLTESEFNKLLEGAIKQVLSETPLNYDIDNFSGRYTKSEPTYEEQALANSSANGDYLDDPFNAPNSFDDDEWVDGDKDMENDYSWQRFDNKPIARSADGFYKINKSAVPSDVDNALDIKNRKDGWTNRELDNSGRMMKKWVDGERDVYDIDDAWAGVHESIEIDPKNKGKFNATKERTRKDNRGT